MLTYSPRGIKAAIEIMSINQLRVPNTSLSFLPQRNCECQQAEDCEKRRIPLHDALVFQRETSWHVAMVHEAARENLPARDRCAMFTVKRFSLIREIMSTRMFPTSTKMSPLGFVCKLDICRIPNPLTHGGLYPIFGHTQIRYSCM